MKKKQKKGIDLRKLTIARINNTMLLQIQGGDCNVTTDDTDTHNSICVCVPTQNIF
ncbi:MULTISPECIES: hypothetical protein [Aquimarina]|uniref:hypothetical protein n=1 Tax=Aquimarina TaxID=290174 RepID=UPI000AC00F2C|nr:MULTISPECIES: hypothetical protein [Aquimarina]